MSDVYSKIIVDGEFSQVRLGVHEFNDVEYLSFREYYLDFNEEWKPTPKGINIPLELETSRELFLAFSEILSLAESREIIEEFFGDIIKDIYVK